MMTPHPEEEKVNAMMYREEPYPESFTTTDRTNERLERIRTGLVHVLTELLPGEGSRDEIYCWLFGVLNVVEFTLIDVKKPPEKQVATRDNRMMNVAHDAGIASKYTGQLLELWDKNLDRRLHVANPTAAARFRTLIAEINSTARRIHHRLDSLEAAK